MSTAALFFDRQLLYHLTASGGATVRVGITDCVRAT